jgi:hypothetical protein
MSLLSSGALGATTKVVQICVISGFRCKVDENCACLGYYAAGSGNSLPRQVKNQISTRTALFWVVKQQVVVIHYRCVGPTFRSHLQGSKKMGPICCVKTLLRDYYYLLLNIPEEHSSCANLIFLLFLVVYISSLCGEAETDYCSEQKHSSVPE